MPIIFYQRKICISVPFSSYIKYENILPLRKSYVWICFANGHWVTYDLIKNAQITQGAIEADFTLVINAIKKPRVYDDNNIVYVDETDLKLHLLNPFTGDIDESWDIDVPTLGILSLEDRNNREKAHDALYDAELVVLENSKTVILMEIKDQLNTNNQYAVLAYKRSSKEPFAQAEMFNSQLKKMYLSKINEDDTICLYSDYTEPNLSFHLWNITKANEGWRHFQFQSKLSTTIVSCGGWEPGKIILFGNPDQGQPQGYICQYEPFNQEIIETYDFINMRNKEAMIKNVVTWDYKTKLLLIEETGCSSNNVALLYNMKKHKFQFYKDIPDPDEFHAICPDKKNFIAYSTKLIGDEDMNKPSRMEFFVKSFVHKKVWLISALRRAQINIQGKQNNLLNYYGHPSLNHIIQMLG